jgi:hypothetical protein
MGLTIFSISFRRCLNFGGKAITVRSQQDDPDSCIIDCSGSDRDPSDSHKGFIFYSGEPPQSMVRGLTILNGFAGSS